MSFKFAFAKTAAVSAIALAFTAGALTLSITCANALDDPKGPAALSNPAPAKGPLEGRPEMPGAQALAPVRGPPLPTAANKLPLAKIKVPAGFKVEV